MAHHGARVALIMVPLLAAAALALALADGRLAVEQTAGAAHGGRARKVAVPTGVRVTCTKVHGVEAGETCSSVARDSRLTDVGFLRLNPNITCAGVFTGQWVCVGGAIVV